MKQHTRKLIAPAVITLIASLVFFGFALSCACAPIPWAVRILGLLIGLALGGACVFALIERIKEVKGGEEDDLGKY